MHTTTYTLAVNAIYDAVDQPGMWPEALLRTAQCLNAAGAVILFRNHTGAITTIVSPNLLEAQKAYERYFYKLDFLAPRLLDRMKNSEKGCFTEQQLASQEEIENHAFFTEFRRPYGLGSLIAAELRLGLHQSVVISIHGHWENPPFTIDQSRLFIELSEHVERSLKLSIQQLEQKTEHASLMNILTQLGCGLYFLDAESSLLFTNENGRQMAKGDISIHQSVLRIKKQRLHKMIKNNPGSNAGIPDKYTSIVVDNENNQKIILHIFPVTKKSIYEELFTSSFFLMLAIPHTSIAPVDPVLVKDLLGLTPGEARLASLVGSGSSPKEAAENLHITKETARTVLKRIYEKTGVSSQSKLATLLSNRFLQF